MTPRVALVGGGRMGGAMIKGWAETGLELALDVHEPVPSPELAELIGGRGWRLNPPLHMAGPADVLIAAVKPQVFAKVASDAICPLVGPKTVVLSIMAGVSTLKLAEITGAPRVVRAMPNTPGQIGRGITALYASADVPESSLALVHDLLRPLGQIETLTQERQMDAVTAVSGSGPAYLFLLTEALAAAGESEGLERTLAERLARQTIIGSAALLDLSGETPSALRKAVTSPEGTTAAALDVLTGGGGLISILRRAVEAAAQRSRQLGR